MPGELENLKNKLLASPQARLTFTADLLNMLERQGVNINDAAVLSEFQIGLEAADRQRFVDETLASSAIITIVM
jgi:hypothetical protein